MRTWRDWPIERLPYARREHRLPVVLSRQEVFALWRPLRQPKRRLLLMTAYSAALRTSELVHLRVEDLDAPRTVPGMTEAILDDLRWLGLDWDEGPVHQADGVDRHRADALRLLEAGKAYRCFCTPETLEAKRAAAEGNGGFRYDRHCLTTVPQEESERRAAAGEPFTVRFRVPEGVTEWQDAVHDRVTFSNGDIEDFIVLRTDGTPIYNMAVVSDDHEMAITHVIRGDDHLSNPPKQILLYEALGWELPTFAHVPMILGSDGKRLSKRHGATAVGQYREHGILPAALVNFLALLGWSIGEDREIVSTEEMAAAFEDQHRVPLEHVETLLERLQMLVHVPPRIELGEAPAGVDGATAAIGQGKSAITGRFGWKGFLWTDVRGRNEQMHVGLRESLERCPRPNAARGRAMPARWWPGAGSRWRP